MHDNNNNINTKSIQREKVFYPQKGIHHSERKHTEADPNTSHWREEGKHGILPMGCPAFLPKPRPLVMMWIVQNNKLDMPTSYLRPISASRNSHPLFCLLEAPAPPGMSISNNFRQPSQRQRDVVEGLVGLPSLYIMLQLPTGGPLT